ncbi:putative peptidase [Hyphodiscus hymeniophilus]|uniref:Probable Xaa-Pro aminopeptidase P n=1 Tax=Hyphodiscus hymeniophilus TaxID=353542 RepID=A0A9P6VHX3_9HELO|nr:putative peptidase [Hyphodiscus hymeniophilus]
MSSSSEKESREPLLQLTTASKPKRRALKIKHPICLIVLIILAIINVFCIVAAISYRLSSHLLSSKALESCAWSLLEEHVSLLDVPAISRSEFLTRQSTLASALQDAGVDAFIAEPSASSLYFANISTTYELSERPFLIIVSASGNFSYLAPKFEIGRIAGLEMAYDSKKVIEWKEEESPYEVLKRETGYAKVMVDEHVRFMIASGLTGVGVDVVPMSREIQSLRAVKSEAELAILKGINILTLQLVRSLQGCIKLGMTQNTIQTAAHGLFTKAGVGEGFWAIVLFGEQAASPHGGSSGGELKNGEFVLIDIGSSLHGYGSDVTRTILPSKSTVSAELMDVWNTVHAAQGAAIELMKVNETCSVVDATSRKVIQDAGLGEFFTHRLGHGLGLEMHEHPYLNGANDEKLKVGEVVTNEPGIYVTPEQAREMSKDVGFGVRIEDAVLVTENGGVVMTGARARSPWKP